VWGNGKGNAGGLRKAAWKFEKDTAPPELLSLSPGGGIREAPAAIAKNGIEIEASMQQIVGARPDRAV